MQELDAAIVQVLLSERIHSFHRLASHESIHRSQLELPEGRFLDDFEPDFLLLLLVIGCGQKVIGGDDLGTVRKHLHAKDVHKTQVERTRLHLEVELRGLEGAVEQAKGESTSPVLRFT